MIRFLKYFAVLMFATGLASPAFAQEEEGTAPSEPAIVDPAREADIIILGGPIYTGRIEAPTASLLAIKDGAILYVGDGSDANFTEGPDTRLIDLAGNALFPGFINAGTHVQQGLGIDLSAATSIEAVLAALRGYAQESQADYTLGYGWSSAALAEKRPISRFDLDRLGDDRPIVLYRKDGAAAALNSAALAYFGVDKNIESPEGGMIHRNSLGEETGLLSGSALALLIAASDSTADDMPNPTRAVREAHMRNPTVDDTSAAYAAAGWTAVHNGAGDIVEARDLAVLSDEGYMGLRIFNSVNHNFEDKLQFTTPESSQNGLVTTHAINLQLDGALAERAAALSEPYAGRRSAGYIFDDKIHAQNLMRQAYASGLQLRLKTEGDLATRTALDWIGEIYGSDLSAAERHWGLSGLRLMDERDITRARDLGIHLAIAPQTITPDMADILGEARASRVDDWAALLAQGIIPAVASQTDNSAANPLALFHALISAGGGANEGIFTREQALTALTLSGAEYVLEGDTIGTIEAGKRADFTAFSVDIMTAEPAEILKARAVLTIVDGVILHQDF